MKKLIFSIFLFVFCITFIYANIDGENPICRERGHIWETVSCELVYYIPKVIDEENRTIIIHCYNGEQQVCGRCGTVRKYKPPCDTMITWKRPQGNEDVLEWFNKRLQEEKQ